MAQSTYETLLKALEEKTKRENAEASDTEQRYYASRVASQQQAQEQRQQNNVFDFTNQRVNNALAISQNQDYQQEPITQIESEEESDSWWDNFWAKTNEILLGLGFAVMKPLEGIVDAGAHVVGWIADKAGNTDLAQGVKDFTARDLTKEAMQSAPYQWMNYVTIGGVQDLIGSAIDGEWKVKGPYESEMWRRSTDDEYESPEWARKTAEGVGQAVGYALLALATGGVGSAIAGGGELGAVGSAVANYAPIAISAGGSATSEALQEGASYDEAMAYGALSGLTEAAAEAFVGNAVNKALGGVGGGVGALSTVKNLKGGKGIIRGLVASANEEGMEEVFSSVLTPMWKALTYKNKEDINFAQRYAKEFEEAGGILGVLQDYAYGAASSLIMGGATVGSNIVRSSDTKTVAGLKRGLQTVQMENYISQVAEIQNDIANEKLKIGFENGEATTPKLKRLEAKLEKLQSEMETKFKDLLDHIEEYSNTETEGLNNAQRKQIATKEAYETSKNVDTDMLAINKLFEDSKVEALESQKAVKAYDERIKALDEQLRTNTTLTTEQMDAIRKEMADNQKARDRIANNLGLYDPSISTTYIRGKRTLRDKFKTALHERLHVALKDASVDNKVRINELIKEQILNDKNYGKDWYNEQLEKIKKEYRNEFKASSVFQKSGLTLDEAINNGKFDYWFEEEISADYLFNLFKNPEQAKKVLNGTFGGKGIANSFMNIIRSAYLGKTRPQGYKELIKALQEVSQTQNAKNTKEFNEKLKQDRENLKIAKKLEKKIDKATSKIEYVEKETEKKNAGTLARAQKDIQSEQVDSEGNTLTQEQQEYFKDSKVRDENGNLLLVHHGTKNDFTVFDLDKTGQSNDIASIGFWFAESEEGVKNFSNSTWYAIDDETEPKSLNGYLNLTKPKIFISSKANEKRVNSIMEKRNPLYEEIDKIKNEFTENEQRGISLLIGNYKVNSEDTLFKFWTKDTPKDKINDLIEAAKKIEELHKKIDKYNDKLLEERYTDAYEKFRTEIYKIAGKNAEDANLGGLGIAIYKGNERIDRKEIVKKYRNKLIKQGYDGIIIKGTRFDNDTLGKNNNQYVAFYSNQFKNSTNLTPTENNDIRYSKQLDDTKDKHYRYEIHKNGVNLGGLFQVGYNEITNKIANKENGETAEKIINLLNKIGDGIQKPDVNYNGFDSSLLRSAFTEEGIKINQNELETLKQLLKDIGYTLVRKEINAGDSSIIYSDENQIVYYDDMADISDIRYSKDLKNAPATEQMQKVVDKYFGIKFDDNSFSEENIKSKVDKFLYNYADKTAFAKKELDLNDSDWESVIKNVKAENVDELKETLNKILLRKYNKYLNDKKEKKKDLPNDYRVTKETVETLFDEIYESINDSDYEEFILDESTFDEFYNDIKAFIPQLEKEYNELKAYFTEVEKTGNYKIKEFRANTTKLNDLNTLAREFFPVIDSDGNKYYENFDIEDFSKEQQVRYRQLLKQIKDVRYLMPKELQKSVEEREAITQKTAQEEKELQSRIEQVKNNKEVKAGYEMVNKFAKIINQRLQNNAGKGENYSSNIRKNKLDGLSIESIEKPLADIEALDLQLNDYKAILIKNDITEAIAQKEIDELKNSEFKNLYNLRELLQKKYYEKKKINSVEETKKTLGKAKEKLEEKKQTETKKENTEQKETFKETIKETGEAVADTITNATGTKVVYIFNEAILKEINQKNYKRKDLLAKKLIDGMLLSVNDNIVKLTALSEDNPFRISAEETIKEIARRMTSKNGDITEDVEALIKTLKQQVKDKEIALNKKDERVSAINERLKELKEERKEIDKTLDKKNKQIKKLISLNEETLDKGKKLKQEIDDLKAKIKNNSIITETLQKDAKKAIREAHKAQRNALRETVELNEKLVSAKNRVNEYFAKLVKARIEAKGKFKVNEDFVGFLQNWGEYFSPYTNFKLTLADCERIGMLLEKPNETHKVIIDDAEVELTNREIALTYYYNKINGSSQQYTSIYQYDMSYQEIFDLIKKGFDTDNTGSIMVGKNNVSVEMALEHVLDDITTTDLTEIGKQQEKYEKLLDKTRDSAIAQYQRYLKKRGELSLYKHSVWAKNRAQAFRKKFESYKSKFGRLSGIDDNWSKMLQKFSDDINALTPNQIANGEFIGALKEFYNTYLGIKGELNKKNIYMPVELEKTIEQIAYANRTDLSKEENLNVIDTTLIAKEDIDLFSQIISGINRFMTDAKEERGAMLAGKWTKLKDASTTGIAEQDYLLEQNKKHNIKYDKYHFINGYVNPAVNFRYWDGFKTDGIFSKFYQTLELAQNKYAQNMIELMQPFADFAKKYKKEFNSLRDKASGIKMNGVELNGTNGQILALYETTKRLWALEHLNACGFVLNENSKIGFDGGEVIRDAVKDWVSNNFNLSTKDSAKVEELILKAVNSKTNVMLDEIRLELADKYGYDFDFDVFKEEMKELKEIRSDAVREQISQLREDIENKYKLNDKDSAYAQYLKASEEFFEKARDLKVEADMQILGFTNVSDDFYFPMYTSSLDNQVNLGEVNYDNQAMSSRDYSFNQNLRSIMGALEIRNIDDIINIHLQQTATYNAYSPAIETIKRVYNWKQSGDQSGRTVANAMKLRYTKEDASKIDRYLHNLINDIQGGTVGKSNVENTFDKVFNFIRGHSIKVSLGANPKVWFSQTTSIPAAMKYIQGKYLVEGLSDLLKTSKGLPEIPYLAQLRKRNGEIIRSETMTSEQDGVLGAVGTGINTVTGAINTISEGMMKPITVFDSSAIRVIWKASLLQTKNTDGSWNVEAATQLFTKTVNETQPNYNPLGRPEILRTKNPLLRLLVMYKTQSFQNLSNAYEAVNRIVYKLRRGIPLEQTIKDANGKIISYGDRDKAIRALIALLLQGILFSSLGYLFKRLINNDWGENTGKNLANDLGLGFVNDNLLGIMPIINKMQVDLNNDRYVKLNINGFTDNIEDTFTKLINPESLAPKDYVTIFANLTGIPATNLYKYSKTFLQYVLPNETIEKIDLGYRGKTVNKQLISKASTERLTRTYYNMFTTEINGNIKENTRREMYRLYQNGNTSVILKETPSNFTVDGVEYSVIPKEFNQTYGKVSDALNNLISSANYSKLDDEEKGWQITKLNEAYYGAAKKVTTNSSFTKFESLAYYDFTFSSDLLSIYHMLTQLEADKRLTKSQVISKYLNKQRVPTGMKYLLWWLAGYGLKDNQKSMVKRYLAQNGVSLKNTKEIIK